MNARQIVNTVSNTLSLVDQRLSNHGLRVANTVYPVLKSTGAYSDRQMRDICLAALLHDIGAFKTEEIDRILSFETIDIWAHSIYGYVFMDELSPLSKIAPAVFFHHADLEWLERVHPGYRDLAQIIHIADRVDILSRGGGVEPDLAAFDRAFGKHRGTLFRGDMIDRFRDVLFSGDRARGAQADFREMLPEIEFSQEETAGYLNMLILSIDFRSSQTVTHSLTTISIAEALADLMRLPPEDKERIVLGAMVHDLGKQGIPLEILESTSRLGDDEMAIMKSHVTLTDNILKNNLDDAIRFIAVRHHEKLDGSGYPLGLSADELTLPQRLVAVADILSALMGVRSYKPAFPKEKVLAIIGEEKAKGRLDASVIDCTADNYERLREVADDTAKVAFETYDHVREQYGHLKNMVEGREAGAPLILSAPLEW